MRESLKKGFILLFLIFVLNILLHLLQKGIAGAYFAIVPVILMILYIITDEILRDLEKRKEKKTNSDSKRKIYCPGCNKDITESTETYCGSCGTKIR